jgi:hypothetical protein
MVNFKLIQTDCRLNDLICDRVRSCDDCPTYLHHKANNSKRLHELEIEDAEESMAEMCAEETAVKKMKENR